MINQTEIEENNDKSGWNKKYTMINQTEIQENNDNQAEINV